MDIKEFKAWDSLEEKIIDNFIEYYSNNDDVSWDDNRYKKLIYIGKKDKNGRKIFEQDLLKTRCLIPPFYQRKAEYEYSLWVVEWDVEGCCFNLREVHENEVLGYRDFVTNFGKGELVCSYFNFDSDF